MTDAERFLDWQILGVAARERMVRERIASIDFEDVVDDWIATEVRLGRGDEGSARQEIIAALNRRKTELKVIGDRDERTTRRDEPRDLPPVEVSYPDRDDVETGADRAVFRGSTRWGSLRDRYPEHFDDGVDVDVDEQGGDAQEGEA